MRIAKLTAYIPVEKRLRTGRESTTPPHGTTIVWRCDEELAHNLDMVAKKFGISRGMLIANTMRAIAPKLLTDSYESEDIEYE